MGNPSVYFPDHRACGGILLEPVRKREEETAGLAQVCDSPGSSYDFVLFLEDVAVFPGTAAYELLQRESAVQDSRGSIAFAVTS